MTHMTAIDRAVRMARQHPECTHWMDDEAIRAAAAVRALVDACEVAAEELIRTGRARIGIALIAAVAEFRAPPPNTTGVLTGNADLESAHASLASRPEEQA